MNKVWVDLVRIGWRGRPGRWEPRSWPRLGVLAGNFLVS